MNRPIVNVLFDLFLLFNLDPKQKKLHTEADRLSEQAVLPLMFPSGFPTQMTEKSTHLLLILRPEDTKEGIGALLFLPKGKNTQKIKSDNMEGNHALS